MKILAFSDLHRDVSVAKNIVEAAVSADVVVGAGDFAIEGNGATDTLDVLRTMTVPFVIVSGNHDNLEELNRITAEWHNCHLLHGTGVTLLGQSFFGLGCEVPQSSDAIWNETLSEQKAEMMLNACPYHAVLVTHAPPLGHCDLQNSGNHEGSMAILKTIQERTIPLHLCGHIHFSAGTTSHISACSIHNLGPTINWFEI